MMPTHRFDPADLHSDGETPDPVDDMARQQNELWLMQAKRVEAARRLLDRMDAGDPITHDDVRACLYGDLGALYRAFRGTFTLYRDVDETGISGTGEVAEGARFSDGSAVVRWYGENTSHAVWPRFESVHNIHGHGGKTRIVWDKAS
jgi:hypothetical protein